MKFLNSVYYFFYKNYSNCRDFSDREITAFPLGQLIEWVKKELNSLEVSLNKSYMENVRIKNRAYDSGVVFYEEYYPALSKHIIDQIDTVLAEHYGFTPEELDFIINYDIKYRMGKELEGDEGE